MGLRTVSTAEAVDVVLKRKDAAKYDQEKVMVD